ncbi:hypothetical protein TrCOL_g7750 [Triparma columacea]|uniref:GPI inositol-deacylase n=1 Tax=Triparma columacea TaxID=722753 RepID=A0A9W7LF12_9STRA|nr:hypothetical protein TrCOL_g7750 [Triparma columacea]
MDWLKVFSRGATDLSFWAGKAPPTNKAFGWYLDLVHDSVQKHDGTPCVLMGHSAGGWLARACLGDGSGNGRIWGSGDGKQLKREEVLAIVTLGAPHYPPPDTSMEMTRGALTLTSELIPGCFHDEVYYMSVGGSPIVGEKQNRLWWKFWEPTTVEGFAYNSYMGVCGKGGVEGDGVVPQCSAHLDGSRQISLGKEGGFHSVNEPERWYGSEMGLNKWLREMEEGLAVAVSE